MANTVYPEADERPLEGGWTLLVTETGRHGTPGDIHRPAVRLSAQVPGTVASALQSAGLYDPEQPHSLLDRDAWYFRDLKGEAPGPAILRFEGLATIAEIYLNGILKLRSTSMFACHDLAVDLTGEDELAICFRALGPELQRKGPRARWRPQMMDNQGLRLVRNTLLGHMPGWCPPIHAMGPYRPISLIRPAGIALADLTLTATLSAAGIGSLSTCFALQGQASTVELLCDGRSSTLTSLEPGIWSGELQLPAIEPWWPRTHGKPKLHLAELRIDGVSHALGLVGFRSITIDRGMDGRDFSLRVNGASVFCRGAVWSSADILSLPGTAEAYAPWLTLAADAGFNMIRLGGTMTYESPEFFKLCDRLGIMVWQDFMFANFDYPAKDEAFRATAEQEVADLLGAIQGSPSLAVLCGGSEIYQQGAMLGLPESVWKGELFEAWLRDASKTWRPDVPYVDNSPVGGAMPFAPNAGVTHYYGVGAYCRPLEDARRAEVRFAAESLAFAQVPQQSTLDRHLPVQPVHDPRWKARVPRDRGASWDFEDIRDHYLALLYDVDPARLRREDPDRYLDLSRAVTGEVSTETFAEWRRPRSTCNGALVWTFQDLMPGAGWGLVDSSGEPKPVWYAMKRAFRPVQVLLTDEGTNGLDIHVINEKDTALETELSLTCLRDGRQPVVSGHRRIDLAPRSALTIPATDLFGAFFDTTYAFRFGPPSHEVSVARIFDVATGEQCAEAVHFPRGRASALFDAEIKASLEEKAGFWFLLLETEVFAQSVHIDCEGFRATDDWFHLAPGKPRRIALHPRAETAPGTRPSGEIVSIGARKTSRF
ncbi:glycoside hydrolase family 2 protein [Rhizobium halophytocola]|uniref:beta-mannosidase n=1 Tax=Rhizobium halophytocola TaxID=735519 RepID=A0ABS4E266_9HYPH|nr:glycoside hydrolase family 2 protein [Rhizobium halophytocola]MBP1852033.1 beta-mannosidase [Rhizobium halophytocola]